MIYQKFLATNFEAERKRLGDLARRILGSAQEAEDAVQEAWLRLAEIETDEVANLRGWLTTVVARICFDALRTRQSRREEPLDDKLISSVRNLDAGGDPAHDLLLADSVGLALLLTLERLAPAERLTFVLHDLFGVGFDAIAPIIERSVVATRQVASRARHKVRGGPEPRAAPSIARQKVVQAFLAASRGGDFSALIALLDPDATLRADPIIVPPGLSNEVRGPMEVAKRAMFGQGQSAEIAMINGGPGIVAAHSSGLRLALQFEFAGARIVRIEVLAHPERLRALRFGMLRPIEPALAPPAKLPADTPC